jgi:hypothetical protein
MPITQTEHAHACTLGQRCHGAIAQRQADDEEANAVIRGIAEEVESVGLQRGRPGREAGNDLDAEHGAVDCESRPQYPAITGIAGLGLGAPALVTATGAHKMLLGLKSLGRHQDGVYSNYRVKSCQTNQP